MESTLIKNIPLSRSRWNQLRRHAVHSFYRMNATSADCYAFSVDVAGMKHMDGTISKGNDWSGGWDWSTQLVDTSAEYILMLETGKVYKVNA